jgi:uncharacterized protein (DUF2164 family)
MVLTRLPLRGQCRGCCHDLAGAPASRFTLRTVVRRAPEAAGIIKRRGGPGQTGALPFTRLPVKVQAIPFGGEAGHMSKIDFSAGEKAVIVNKVKMYFREELDQEIGQFDAEFLLDFFAEEIGPYFYNRALDDARGILQEKLTDITDALYEIEKPTEFRK